MIKNTKNSLFLMIQNLRRFIWASDKKLKRGIIAAIFFSLFASTLRILIPVFFKHIINILSHQTDSTIPALVTLILLIYGIGWFLDYLVVQLRNLIVSNFLERSVRILSQNIVNHLISLSLRFHVDKKTGAITNHIQRLQSGFDNIFWGIFSFLLPTLIEMTLAVSLIHWMYGWVYSTALFSVMLGYAILNLFGMKRLLKAQEMYNQKSAYTNGRIVDSLINFETVKYFNNEEYEFNQIRNALEQQEQAGLKRSITGFYLQFTQAIFLGLGFIYLTWMSGMATYHGQMKLGDFVLINGYLMQFIIPLAHLGYVMSQIQKGLQNVHDAFNILSIEPEVQDILHPIHLKIETADIVLENIDFGYTVDRCILKGISFVIPAGKKLAIVGHTGSGKSTIGRLLFRFYNVTSGRIKINGHDIRSISQSSLHQAIGVVPQDTVLFNETLRYNILYGNPKASQKEVEAAAALARLEYFIDSLPDGYDTLVGERGLKLSGGEKQRVAIARVILKKPAFYIFDEATSSLDTVTEREIQQNLNQISVGATTVTIAHRLSTIIHADEIIVLNQGKIVETGNHDELLQKEGFYAKLWQEQQNSSHMSTALLNPY